MHEFDAFVPSSWIVDGLEVIPRVQRRKVRPANARNSSWNIVFAASVLTIGVALSTASLSFDPRQSSIVFSNPNRAQSELGGPEDDRSFKSLFASYQSGRPLLGSDRMRQIAQLAVEAKPNPNIDAWAERLANDVSKADD